MGEYVALNSIDEYKTGTTPSVRSPMYYAPMVMIPSLYYFSMSVMFGWGMLIKSRTLLLYDAGMVGFISNSKLN